MNRMLSSLIALLMTGSMVAWAQEAAPYNAAILNAISAMPFGGGYSGSRLAKAALVASVTPSGNGFDVAPKRACPSFCSGATYLVFLQTLDALQQQETLTLDLRSRAALLIGNQADGEGVWGRWNANGPGTARLFYEMGLGPNFSDFDRAKAGDFMKIFWTNAVGRKEHGHSVIYLGQEKVKGVDSVRFWSSNVKVGYGEKTVPRNKIAAAIFSRLLYPQKLSDAAILTPHTDPYLASLLSKDSSLAEAKQKCGM